MVTDIFDDYGYPSLIHPQRMYICQLLEKPGVLTRVSEQMLLGGNINRLSIGRQDGN